MVMVADADAERTRAHIDKAYKVIRALETVAPLEWKLCLFHLGVFELFAQGL